MKPNLPRGMVATILLLALTISAFAYENPTPSNSASGQRDLTNSPLSDPKFFPLAVWLQSPANAARYKAAGINTYIGLWKGPTADQINALKKSGMWIICDQNAYSRSNLSESSIIAWMHGDEPDNAQALRSGNGWGPPILPSEIVSDYGRIKKTDPSRPVLLNLGQGVAWDRYYGRGVRSNHPEDYPKYIEGCDIVSFDIYPAIHDSPEVAGKLWYVAQGVERLVRWSEERKTVWNCLECTRISNVNRKPTPHEVRAEAWMSIIHGSRGLIYFVHQFKPVFNEAALLDDPEMLQAVTRLNRQITELAPVINGPSAPHLVSTRSHNEKVPVASMVRRHASGTYIFAVCMRDEGVKATFQVNDLSPQSRIEVVGEDRTLRLEDGKFEDQFGPWDARIYRLTEK